MSNPTTTKPRAKRPAKAASAPMELMPVEDRPQHQMAPVAAPDSGPMRLLELAVNRGASVEELERLMQLADRHEAKESLKAYTVSMAEFKRNPPTIVKNKLADFEGRNGRVSYSYADLASVVKAIAAGLAQHGFSHAWSTRQDGALVSVTCVLTHERGHSTSTTLSAAPDNTGSKNPIQAVGSAVSYLERYTLLAACGIAVEDGGDDDGASTGYQMTDEDRQSVRGNGRNHKPADVAASKQRPGRQGAPDDQLLADARGAADQGPAVFGPYWRALTDIQRKALSAELPDLQQRAGRKGAN